MHFTTGSRVHSFFLRATARSSSFPSFSSVHLVSYSRLSPLSRGADSITALRNLGRRYLSVRHDSHLSLITRFSPQTPSTTIFSHFYTLLSTKLHDPSSNSLSRNPHSRFPLFLPLLVLIFSHLPRLLHETHEWFSSTTFQTQGIQPETLLQSSKNSTSITRPQTCRTSFRQGKNAGGGGSMEGRRTVTTTTRPVVQLAAEKFTKDRFGIRRI